MCGTGRTSKQTAFYYISSPGLKVVKIRPFTSKKMGGRITPTPRAPGFFAFVPETGTKPFNSLSDFPLIHHLLKLIHLRDTEKAGHVAEGTGAVVLLLIAHRKGFIRSLRTKGVLQDHLAAETDFHRPRGSFIDLNILNFVDLAVHFFLFFSFLPFGNVRCIYILQGTCLI